MNQGFPSGGFIHQALIYPDESGLVERGAEFVDDGLRSGEEVVVIASDEMVAAVCAPLGGMASRLSVVARPSDFRRGPHQALLTWDVHIARMVATGAPWRLLAEPAWLAEPGAGEWHRLEAAVNLIYADLSFAVLCVHDGAHLRSATLDKVRRTHPLVDYGLGPSSCPDYMDPAAFVEADEPPWAEVPPDALVHRIDRPAAARYWANETADALGLADRADDVMLAVTEAASNAIEQGADPVLSVWSEADTVVFDVTDHGPGGIPPLAGYVPPSRSSDSGRGLWLCRSLSDDGSMRSGPDGSTVRMYFQAAKPLGA